MTRRARLAAWLALGSAAACVWPATLREVDAERLTAEAELQLGPDPGTALLLALAAHERAPAARTRTVLRAALDRLHELRTLGPFDPPPLAVAWAGDQLLTGNGDGQIHRWTAPWQRAELLATEPTSIQSIAVAPSGTRMLTAGSGGWTDTTLWALPDARRLATLFGARAPRFTPDGRWIVALSTSGGALLFDGATGAERRQLEVPGQRIAAITSLAGGQIVTATDDGRVQFWDGETGALRGVQTGGRRRIVDLSASADLPRIAARTATGELLLFDLRTAAPALLRSAHGAIAAARFVGAEPQLATTVDPGDGAPAVTLWALDPEPVERLLVARAQGLGDPTDPRCLPIAVAGAGLALRGFEPPRLLAELHGHAGACVAVAVDDELRHAASIGADATLRIWSLRPAAALSAGLAAAPAPLATASAGALLAVDGRQHELRLFDLAGEPAPRLFFGHDDEVVALAIDPQRRWLASAGETPGATLWELASGLREQEFEGHLDRVTALAFAPDGACLASASFDRSIRLWNPADGSELRALEGHAGAVLAIAFAPDGMRLASGGRDGAVRIWHVATGAEQQVVVGHRGPVTHLAWSPDGRLLASAGDDHRIRVVDPADGSLRATFTAHRAPFTALAFAGASRLFAGAADGARIWDVASGAEHRAFRAPLSATAAAIDAPAQLAATATEDGEVQVWEVASGALHERIPGPRAPVRWLAFVGPAMDLCGRDEAGTLWRWPADVVAAARERVPRTPNAAERRRHRLDR
jgi:WD40 repeat protein